MRVPLKEFVEDWREVMESTPRDRYGSVVSPLGGREFTILTISHFDDDVDGTRPLIETSSREFDDGSAYFIHTTRDAQLARVITHRGRRRYVVEPGPDALDYMAGREGVSKARLLRAARDGELGRRLARGENRKRRDAEATIAALNDRIRDLEEEIAALDSERRHLSRELAGRGAERLVDSVGGG